MVVRYLTHPQVQIDPALAVPSWGLSTVGHERVRVLVGAGWLSGTTQIVSSAERKAIETARPIAMALGIEVEVRAAMHENDRSATGYLAAAEFESVADQFFAQPHHSVRGWERAADAQARIVSEAETVLGRDAAGDVLFVGHGGVGTLLLCHYLGSSIDRAHDQPAGGGNFFTLRKDGRRLLHAWRRMEQQPPC